MTKNLYEENKRLKAEVKRLEKQRWENNEKEQQQDKIASDLCVSAVIGFLNGSASIFIDPVNGGGYRVTFIL